MKKRERRICGKYSIEKVASKVVEFARYYDGVVKAMPEFPMIQAALTLFGGEVDTRSHYDVFSALEKIMNGDKRGVAKGMLNRDCSNMETKDYKIINELRQLAAITSGRQREYYELLINRAVPVHISPLREVFNADELQQIKSAVQLQEKECYKNATMICGLFPDRVRYVEGRFTVCGAFSTEHAWNRLGGKYFDVTMELVLERNPEEEEYMALGDYTYQELLDYLLDAKVYGNIVGQEFIKIKKTHEK